MTEVHEGKALGPIVVGVDESESARNAVRWAAAEAARRRTALRLVLAFSLPGTGVFDTGTREDYIRLQREAAVQGLGGAAALAGEVVPGVEIEQEVRPGTPVPSLLDESERAMMVVLGSRGRGGFIGMLTGSTAVALAARGHCPVVVVRATGTEPGTEQTEQPGVEISTLPIVVGIDGSPVSEAALTFAFEEASLRGVPLVAVHAWMDYALEPAVAAMIDWNALEEDGRLVLGERLAGWSQRYPEVEVRRVVVRDRPAQALVEQSKDAQLVVVGSRGRGEVAGFFLGSVSHAVLHHAQCPMAVVRPVSGGSGELRGE